MDSSDSCTEPGSDIDGNNFRKRKHDEIGNSDPVDTDRDDMSAVVTATRTTALQPHIQVRVGDEIRHIQQSTFLSSIWKDGCLDSPCMVCHRPFDTPGVMFAPIRTIGFDYFGASQTPASVIDMNQVPLTPHPIQIYNRHLGCIMVKVVKFIPVSHAWHEEIALARDDGVNDIDAAVLAYQVPVKILLAADKKYAHGVEIWHDYISVPQWQKETKQQLLFSVPAIFKYVERFIVHLDDVLAYRLTEPNERMSYEAFLYAFMKIAQSRWFGCAWTTLEYIQGKKVLVASKEYEIVDSDTGDLLSRTQNTLVAKYIKRDGHLESRNYIVTMSIRWKREGFWTYMESWKECPEKPRTFGDATHILSLKKCRDPKDYYFTLGVMIGFDPGADIARRGIQGTGYSHDSFECFYSLLVHALANGDYSPLLMNHIRGEKPDPRAPWVRGYSQLPEHLWDLGICHRTARNTEIIQDGVIQPELESVGEIDWLDISAFIRRGSSTTSKMVLRIVTEIVRSTGTCPKAFSAAIDRNFPAIKRKTIYEKQGNDSGSEAGGSAHTPAPGSSSTSTPEDKLREMLEEFSALLYADPGGDGIALDEMQNLSRVILTQLRLDESSIYSTWLNLTFTQSEAQAYGLTYGDRDMECLARVRCKYCGRRCMFRLTLWKEPSPFAVRDSGGLIPANSCQVYRIPGLLFDETVPDGVGLVVEWNYDPSPFGTVIGRMIYGTGAGTCDCRKLERVRLGKATMEAY